MTPPRRVLLNVSSGIGDAIMATPVIGALRRDNADVVIDLIVSVATKGLFASDPSIHLLHVIPPRFELMGMVDLIRNIRRAHYDAIIGCLPSNTVRQIMAVRCARSALRIKHRTPHSGFRNLDFLFDRLEDIRQGRHRVDCNLDLIRHIGINPDMGDRMPMVHVGAGERSSARRKLLDRGFDDRRMLVGFHPGCSPLAAFKRWPAERYATLGDYLKNEYGAQIVLLGGPDEASDADQVRYGMAVQPISLVGQCSLTETAAVLEHCRFLVTNDSGIMHLATAVRIPVFAIFGPKDDRHVGPYGPTHTVIRSGQKVDAVRVEQVISVLRDSPHGPAAGKS